MALLLALPVAAQKQSAIEWQQSFDAAAELASRTGRPLLVEFWATWCGPCKEMDRDVWPHLRIAELTKKYVCVSVDVDRDPVAKRFRIESIPTVVVMEPWGRVLLRREGYIHVNDLADMLAQAPADYSEAREASAALRRDPKHLQALVLMGHFYKKNGSYELSSSHYREAMDTKEAKDRPELHQDLEFSIALNLLRQEDWKAGRKALDRFLKDHPDAAASSNALSALVLAHTKMGKLRDAEETFERLKLKYPDSKAVQTAAGILQQAATAR
jgi:thioredoxin-like negative regulator of GroEL